MHHTSNWDFPIGIIIRPIMGVDIAFAGKNSLFFFPLGIFMKWLGGYPVDRSKHTNFVDACVEIFNRKDSFKLCIAPEGTPAANPAFDVTPARLVSGLITEHGIVAADEAALRKRVAPRA